MKLTFITKDHVLISIGWSLLDLEHLNIESCPRRVNRWAKSLIYPLQSWHLLYDWLLLDMLCCDWLYQTVGINPCLSLSTCILSLVLPHSHPEYLSVRFPHCPWPDISSQHRTRTQYYLISQRLITNILQAHDWSESNSQPTLRIYNHLICWYILKSFVLTLKNKQKLLINYRTCLL